MYLLVSALLTFTTSKISHSKAEWKIGMDMAYRFLWHYWGPELAVSVANGVEYAPHTHADWDPFSVIHKLPGADYSHSLIDCVGPAELPTKESE